MAFIKKPPLTIAHCADSALRRTQGRELVERQSAETREVSADFSIRSLPQRGGQPAELVKLGHVALDGTKVGANAPKHEAMSYGRMKQEQGKEDDKEEDRPPEATGEPLPY